MANILEINRPSNKITLGTTGTTINIASHTASKTLALDGSKNLESIQDLRTTANPQFAGLGLGVAATAGTLVVRSLGGDGEDIFVIERATSDLLVFDYLSDGGTDSCALNLNRGGTTLIKLITRSTDVSFINTKFSSGSFASPLDVTNTRQYGFELHYSGNNYNVTAIRARAQLITTDTSASAQGALLQAANNDGIDVGVLNGALIEAIGKATTNAATISMMRGCLVNTEWSAKDTVTDLRVLHVRTHTRDAAIEGYVSGTGYGIYIENEAVGGNGQALDAGIYFKGTNLSAGNKAFTYGIDFSGATYGTADIKLSTANIFTDAWGGSKFNTFLGIEVCGAGNLLAAGIQNTGIGYKALENITTGDANTMVGYKAGGEITAGIDSTGCGRFALGFNTGSRNTGVGANTGVTGDGSGCVFLGFKAGYYETGSSKLFIDNVSRTNEADGRVKALMYGVFAAAVADQDLVFNADVGINTIPTLPLDVKAKAGITAIGGYAIKLTNKTGGNTVAGQLVIASIPLGADTDDAFETAGASAANVIGIILDAGVADGSEAWIVISGIADVLMDGGGSTRGDRIISSGTAGSADVWNVGGAVATHFLEIGHCIETRIGAGLARCVLHFN